MSARPCVFALLAVGLLASSLAAQGFYQNRLWRNPSTGKLEFIEGGSSYYGPGYVPWVTPDRSRRTFQGAHVDPYSGNVVQSQVRRNPMTGRLDVANEFYNPYTGARVVTGRRFNPFTGRYETGVFVTPPSQPPPSQAYGPSAQPDPSATPPRTAERPKVIETNPNAIDSNPLLLPPVPPVAQDAGVNDDKPRGF